MALLGVSLFDVSLLDAAWSASLAVPPRSRSGPTPTWIFVVVGIAVALFVLFLYLRGSRRK